MAKQLLECFFLINSSVLFREKPLPLYKLEYILFCAEYDHLNNYGRPITGALYQAYQTFLPGKKGPLKRVHPASQLFKYNSFNPDIFYGQEPMSFISKTDAYCLFSSFADLSDLNEDELSDHIHSHSIWRGERVDLLLREGRINEPHDLLWEDFIENKELLDELLSHQSLGLTISI